MLFLVLLLGLVLCLALASFVAVRAGAARRIEHKRIEVLTSDHPTFI